ncbi:MAG: hypothetical protein ACKV2T_39655 [Kofleriaceae bacterium]
MQAMMLALVAACSSPPPNRTSPPPNLPAPYVEQPARIPGPDEPLATDGQPCSRNEHCSSGVCEGEGCGVQGVCVPAMRSCTKDLRTFCSCDGSTFQASGSCPGRMYASKGACPTNMNRPDGATCTSAAECASRICEGEGCDGPGRCAPRDRTCTADDIPYCDCDGRTRHTTSSCPSVRFAKRGPCD